MRTKRIWETNGQHFIASYNHDTDDIERVTVSREGFDVTLGWDSLTLAEQHEIENKFADLGGYTPHVISFSLSQLTNKKLNKKTLCTIY